MRAADEKTVSAARAINAIPQTDFTFGRVESLTDKGLWYLPRYITGTTFINESYAKTQSFLEEIFGKEDTVHVQVAIMLYCDPFIENHEDLSVVNKKELRNFCMKLLTTKIESNNKYIRKNLSLLLKETFPFFQEIHTRNLIEFEEKEWILLQDFLDVESEKQSWEHCRDFLVKMVQESFGNIDIFVAIVQKIISHLKSELEEWTML